MADIKITLHKKYIVETVTEVNPDLDASILTYVNNLIAVGCKRNVITPDTITATITQEQNLVLPFEPHHLPFILSYDLGGVVNYSPYIKVSESNVDQHVTEGLPNRTYLDEEEVEQIHTWRSWKINSNYPLPEPVGGYYYLLSYRGTGNYLLDTELLLIYNDINTELINNIPIQL